MTSRREFLQVAAATGLPVIAAGPVNAATAMGVTPLPTDIHAVLVDRRHAASRRVGARLASAGAQVQAMADADITHVWLHQIGPAWRQRPVAIAGLTARSALFCLEQLALSRGLRVVFHGEHVIHPDGRTEHSILRGAQRAQISARDLTHAGAQWPALVADALTRHRRTTGPERFGPSDAALEPALPSGAQLLTSWIIAPV